MSKTSLGIELGGDEIRIVELPASAAAIEGFLLDTSARATTLFPK